MNLQTQDVWIDTKEQTDSVRFVKGYAGDFTLGREYLEKRSGVIILTKDELDNIIRKVINDFKDNKALPPGLWTPIDYAEWETKYINQFKIA